MSTTQLQSISIYPIKSSAGLSLSSSWVDKIGLPFDRRFVICDNQGQFITARTLPKLCLIKCNITETGIILTAPDMPLLQVNYHECKDEYQHVTIWKDTMLAQRCSDAVDSWISKYVGKNVHLLYFGEQTTRYVSKTTNPVAFADGYPLLLISTASLADLNSHLKQPVTMAQFRPNLIVEGCEPFAEDTWKHIRIGEVEFEISKPCSRCIFTTVNPLTGEKQPQQEPLATLKSYRQVASGDVMFGQNLIPLNKGQVNAGDKVTVLETQPPIIFNASKKSRVNNSVSSSVNSSLGQFNLTCTKVIDETHDVKTFVFTGEKLAQVSYSAGQHLPFSLNINGEKTNAVYTLSSSPTRKGYLAITVKRVPNGKVSNYLHDHFTIGNSIEAKAPAGNFHLDALNGGKNKLLLLSAGSGITPMLSMLKALVDNAVNNNVVFFHSARNERDLIAKHEVAGLAKQQGNCQVHYTLTQSAMPNWQDYQGHLTKEMLANIPELTKRQVMVCGPEGFRESAKQLLLELGLPSEQFHFESFGTRKKTSTVQEESEAIQASKPVNILFDSWDKYVKGNNQQTLLEQGEDAGLILPYSCRGGMCGSCKVKLESGDVKQLADDGLMAEEKAQGYVLACSCVPTSDVVVSKP